MMIPSNSEKKIKVAIVITAAGSSTRMGGSVKKEYLPLGDGTVLSACIKSFLTVLDDPEIIITIPPGGIKEAEKAAAGYKVFFVEGSNTRQKSVFNALEFIKQKSFNPDYVLIHDGARPFITPELITDVLNNTQKYEAAVPGITPTDTIKGLDENGFIVAHLVRKNLTAVQTPQGFEFNKLYEAHKKAAGDYHDYTDDSEIWGKYCGPVKLVIGDIKNHKITYPEDIQKWIASSQGSSQSTLKPKGGTNDSCWIRL